MCVCVCVREREKEREWQGFTDRCVSEGSVSVAQSDIAGVPTAHVSMSRVSDLQGLVFVSCKNGAGVHENLWKYSLGSFVVRVDYNST